MNRAMTSQRAPGEEPRPSVPLFAARLRRYRDDNATFTTTRGAIFEVRGHLSRKQSATVNTGAAMKRLGQMVGLMHLAPHSASSARPTQMHGIACPATAHLPPVAITDCADTLATVADDDRTVGLAFLVAHMPPSSLSGTLSCR